LALVAARVNSCPVTKPVLSQLAIPEKFKTSLERVQRPMDTRDHAGPEKHSAQNVQNSKREALIPVPCSLFLRRRGDLGSGIAALRRRFPAGQYSASHRRLPVVGVDRQDSGRRRPGPLCRSEKGCRQSQPARTGLHRQGLRGAVPPRRLQPVAVEPVPGR